MEVWEENFFLSNLRRCIPCQEYPEGGDGRPEISLEMETEPSLSEKRKRFKKQHYLTWLRRAQASRAQILNLVGLAGWVTTDWPDEMPDNNTTNSSDSSDDNYLIPTLIVSSDWVRSTLHFRSSDSFFEVSQHTLKWLHIHDLYDSLKFFFDWGPRTTV